MERHVARDSGVCVIAKRGGVIEDVDASRIVVRVNEEEMAQAKRVSISITDQIHALKPKYLYQPAHHCQPRRRNRVRGYSS